MFAKMRKVQVEIPEDVGQTVVLPKPSWARIDAICGRRGIVQVSKQTFYEALAGGEIRFLKTGDQQQSCCVYSVEDFERWIAARAKTKAAADGVAKPEEDQ